MLSPAEIRERGIVERRARGRPGVRPPGDAEGFLTDLLLLAPLIAMAAALTVIRRGRVAAAPLRVIGCVSGASQRIETHLLAGISEIMRGRECRGSFRRQKRFN